MHVCVCTCIRARVCVCVCVCRCLSLQEKLDSSRQEQEQLRREKQTAAEVHAQASRELEEKVGRQGVAGRRNKIEALGELCTLQPLLPTL